MGEFSYFEESDLIEVKVMNRDFIVAIKFFFGILTILKLYPNEFIFCLVLIKMKPLGISLISDNY